MSSPYRFGLRTRNAVRLLELQPGSSDDPDIHFSLRHTNLGTAKGTFEALSYTWGDTTQLVKVFCSPGNAQLPVTRNCYDALRSLRYPSRTRLLWIDAICINQDDIQERNSQVLIMGNIYNAANRVVIFLGNHTPGSRLLFQHLHASTEWIASGKDIDLLPPPTAEIVNEMYNLLARPWFSRIWVIQELYNAPDPDEALFVCDDDGVPFDTIRHCIFGYHSTRVVYRLPTVLEIVIRDHDWSGAKSAAQQILLLAAFSSLSTSTDPRDRIIALTPLIRHRSASLQRLIDYQKTTETLFEEFALFLLQNVGLAMISVIHGPHSRNMPSWVPDWSSDADIERLVSYYEVFFHGYSIPGDLPTVLALPLWLRQFQPDSQAATSQGHAL